MTARDRGEAGPDKPGYWKVWVRVKGETEFVANAVQYANKEWAEIAARDLYARWLQVDEWKVVRITESDNGDTGSAGQEQTQTITG